MKFKRKISQNSKANSNFITKNPWLGKLGILSFGAYLIHPIILTITIGVISFFDLNNWFSWLLAGINGIFISFFIAYKLRKIPLISFII